MVSLKYHIDRDGISAWTTAVVGFFALFASSGTAYSFGIYYMVLLDVFEASAFDTAFVGSLNMAIHSAGGRL